MTEQHTLIRWVAGILRGIATFLQHCQCPGARRIAVLDPLWRLSYGTNALVCQGAVKDWTSLKGELRKWQVVASLSWTEDEVLDVARYLNDNIHRLDQTDDRLLGQT